jgi:hypothetical protein
MDMPQPRIKRYALVPDSRNGAVRRFHLARVTSAARATPDPERFERMEEAAARERRDGDALGRA